MTSDAAVVAGGVLAAAGTLSEGMSAEDITARLTELLDGSTLWRRADDRGGLLSPLDAVMPSAAAGWSVPDAEVVDRLAGPLEAAWATALAGPHRHQPVVRFTVSDNDALTRLEAIDSIDEVRLSPVIAKSAYRFLWRWPVRVGVLAGPRADRWLTSIAASGHAGHLYDAFVVQPDDRRDLEILVVDDAIAPGAEQATLSTAQAACVIVVGDGPVGGLLDRAARELSPAIAVGVSAPDVDWFVPFMFELSHDQPVDAALALAAPGALVAADPTLITFTAVGRWAAAVSIENATVADDALHVPAPGDDAVPRSLENAPPTAADNLSRVVTNGDFTYESHAATEISGLTRPLLGTEGELVLERRMLMSAAPPPAEEPQPAEGFPARRLLVDVTRDGELCTRALTPDTDHQLEVVIAVPDRPDEGVAFDESSVPAEPGGVAHLTVVIACDSIGLRESRPLDLPTADRTLPSSVAVVAFHTGADGSTLAFDVVVLHGKRPISEARVLATVRATPARRDRVQIVAVPLSSQAEPDPDATAAGVMLDARDGRITNVETGASIAIDGGDVRTLLDDIELRASRILAGDGAVEWKAGARAPALLIELARVGSQLNRKLADVDVDGTGNVALHVRYDTPIIPIELAYSGPAPSRTAKLCAHATRPPKTATRCTKASTQVACPYAFWGMYRTIARDIELRPRRSSVPRTMAPLRLQSVLYGAAEIADKEVPAGTPKEEYPSTMLEQALAGAGGTEVERVTNWRRWRTQVRATRPELLVALAHTETVDGESTLLIGKRSLLAQPDVTSAFVTGEGSAAPLVVLLACASGVAGDDFFGALPASFTDSGAAAVVATLSKLKGPDGARAAASVVAALRDGGSAKGTTLGEALTTARRSLVKAGLLVGLVLVAHGEVDVKLVKD